MVGALIERRWGTSITPPTSTKPDNNNWEAHEDDDEIDRTVLDIEYSVDAAGSLLNQQPAYDRLLHAEVQI